MDKSIHSIEGTIELYNLDRNEGIENISPITEAVKERLLLLIKGHY